MTQDEVWQQKYDDVVSFIKAHHRNPSRYDDAERGRYCNWIRHNRKLFNNGELKDGRVERFKELIELMEEYKHLNQYV